MSTLIWHGVVIELVISVAAALLHSKAIEVGHELNRGDSPHPLQAQLVLALERQRHAVDHADRRSVHHPEANTGGQGPDHPRKPINCSLPEQLAVDRCNMQTDGDIAISFMQTLVLADSCLS